MDLDELSARLSSLEEQRDIDARMAAQQAFMDKYGSRMSNNASLGSVILNELNRRGIDTSAADEAVQQIIDQLRMEATMLLDTLKDNMEQASELVDKLDAVEESVQAAADATGADVSLPSEEMAAEAQGEVPPDQMPPDQMPPEQMPPEQMSPEQMPPEQMPPEQMPPEMMGGEVPPDQMPPEMMGGEMPPEQMPPEMIMVPPQQVPSDRRVKNIKGILSDVRAKRVKKDVSFKVDPSILKGCRGE